jgi:hypothetical protein
MQILNSEQPSTVKKTGGSQPVPNNGHIEVTKKNNGHIVSFCEEKQNNCFSVKPGCSYICSYTYNQYRQNPVTVTCATQICVFKV